jgi:hypothetical protein
MLFAMADQGSKEIIVFKSQDGEARIEVTTDYDTVWLTQAQLVELFQRDKSVISRHLNNIFEEKELEKESVVANFATTAADGKTYQVDHYSLDVVISVGYRVKSRRGVEFRQWATRVLKQYLVEGYALNAARLKNAPGSLLELFKMQIQLWERQELINTEIQDEIKNVGEKILSIEAKITSADENYFTIAGYCAFKKIPCPLNQAKEWGKAATTLSRQRNIPTGTAHDERFGKVRTYHRDILKDVIK